MRQAYAVVMAGALLVSSRAKADQQEDAVSRATQPLRPPASAVWSQCPQPSYPVEAARAGTTGMTRLAYRVDTDGSVVEAKIKRSSGSTFFHAQLDQAALAALNRCRFKAPTGADGSPVRISAEVEYVWRLDGVLIDPLTALRQAAERRSADSQMQLGHLLEQGVGVQRNLYQAVQWYRRAAELGDPRGQSALAWAYFWGRGIAQDDRQAFEWAQRGAEQGYPRAATLLALLYGHGRGVERDDTRSAYWYQKAAAQGDAGAQNNLGESYRLGRGVTQDFAEALRWYSASARQGDATALSNIGEMYEKGQSLAQSDFFAYVYFTIAARRLNSRAQQELDALTGKLSPDQRSEAREMALRWTLGLSLPGLPLKESENLPLPSSAPTAVE